MDRWQRFTFIFLLWSGSLIAGLEGLEKEGVRLIFPSHVLAGENLTMICMFKMPKTSIYTVKWYKGTREIFRYTPKQVPQKQIFGLPGLYVDENQSEIDKLLIRNVPLGMTGNVSCEVTIEPKFSTVTQEGYILVVDVPQELPKLEIEGPLGPFAVSTLGGNESLKAICTSGPAKPATNLTFLVNDIALSSKYVKVSENPEKITVGGYEHEVTRAEAKIPLKHANFVEGKIRVQCEAKLLNFYNKKSNEFTGFMLRPKSSSSVFSFGRSKNGERRSAAGKLVWSITGILVSKLVLLTPL